MPSYPAPKISVSKQNSLQNPKLMPNFSNAYPISHNHTSKIQISRNQISPKKKKSKKFQNQIPTIQTNLKRNLRSLQAERSERSFLEGSTRRLSLSDVLPSPAIELLTANQPQTRGDEVILDQAELPSRVMAGNQRQRRRRGIGGSRGEAGADSESLADEEASLVAGGGGQGLGG